MLGDAHSTNWAENFQFLINQNNPTNFERIWQRFLPALPADRRDLATGPCRSTRSSTSRSSRSWARTPSTPRRRSSTAPSSPPRNFRRFGPRATEILTNTVVMHFFPNSWDPFKKVNKTVDGKAVEELYDPNVNNILEEIAKLAGQFGAARIVIEGHTDSSMKGQVPSSLVKELSLNRANAIKEALVQKYTDLDPNRFNVDGVGWDRPADPTDPVNHTKNRRVEIKVLTAEKSG